MLEEASVEHRQLQLDVSKVSRAKLQVLVASLAYILVLSADTHSRIHASTLASHALSAVRGRLTEQIAVFHPHLGHFLNILRLQRSKLDLGDLLRGIAIGDDLLAEKVIATTLLHGPGTDSNVLKPGG